MSSGFLPKTGVLLEVVQAAGPSEIIEIGSWKGASAVAVLRAAKQAGAPSPRIVCIDTFLGSKEHWLNQGGPWGREQLRIDGFSGWQPAILEDFVKNLRDAGLERHVEILRAPSKIALPFLRKIGRSADLLYIDGDHSFGSVLRDIHGGVRLLRVDTPSVLVGDDWNWPSVRWAVLLSTIGLRWTLVTKGKQSTWVLLNPKGCCFDSQLDALLNLGWERHHSFLLPSLAPGVWGLLDRLRGQKRRLWRFVLIRFWNPVRTRFSNTRRVL